MQLTNGHDFLDALAEYLRKKHTQRGLGDKNIASTLRTAYRSEDFARTQLYADMETWAVQHELAIYN